MKIPLEIFLERLECAKKCVSNLSRVVRQWRKDKDTPSVSQDFVENK